MSSRNISRARHCPEPLGDRAVEAAEHEAHGEALSKAGFSKASLRAYQKAAAIHVEANDHASAAKVFTNAANRSGERGDYEASNTFHGHALDHHESAKDHAAAAKSYTVLAQNMTREGDHVAAKLFHSAAAISYREAGDHKAAAISDTHREKSMVKSWFQLKNTVIHK